MYFKRLTLIALLITACAREHERATEPLEIELKGSSDCLTQAPDKLKLFTQGALSDGEVRAFWDCASGALADFRRLTRGDVPGGHTPWGVRRFLERYFLKNTRISNNHLGQFMVLKRVLVGGREDLITSAEITRAREFLVELREASVTLNPAARVLFGNITAGEDETRLAADRLRTAADRIGAWLNKNNEPLAIARLQAIASELNVPDADLLVPLKRILVGGAPLEVAGGEWHRLTGQLADLTGAAVGLRHAFGEGLHSGLARQEIPRAMSTLARMLETARPSEGDWRALFAHFDQPLFPAWRWVLTRLLDSPDGGVHDVTIARLRAWADVWRRALRDGTGLEEILATGAPLAWDGEGRLVHDGATHAWSTAGRRQMAWEYALLGRLRDVYAPNRARLTLEQVQRAVDEVLPLLHAFGWLADTKPSVAARLLRQADLFNQASDGDGELSLLEATRELANVLSAYQTARVWLEVSGPDPAAIRRPGPRVLAALPRLARAHDPATFSAYVRQAEETVLGAVKTEPYGTGDLVLVATLFHYVEGFLERFDFDGDERIDRAESEPAYLIYGPTLGRVLAPAGLPPEEILAFFTFLLKYGDTPFGMLGGQIVFNNWKWHQNDWAFRADRQRLMGILNQLSKL